MFSPFKEQNICYFYYNTKIITYDNVQIKQSIIFFSDIVLIYPAPVITVFCEN